MKTVLFATGHVGGANCMYPVIEKLKKDKKINHLAVFSDGDAKKVFDNNKIRNSSCVPDLSKEFVSLVVTGSHSPDDSLDKRLILEAQEKGIRTLSILDFWGAYHKSFSSEGKKDFFYLPNKIAVLDEIAKNEMLKEGFYEDNLVITGKPDTDYLADLVKQCKGRTDEIREELGFDPRIPLIMYASQPVSFYYNGKDYPYLGYTELSVLEQVIEARDSFDEKVNLLVKTHPAEEEDGACKTIGKILDILEGKKNVILKRKGDYDTMKAAFASDVIVSTFSTVLGEAAYMDKLALSLQPEIIGDDKLDTNKYGVTVGVYNSEEIKPTLEKALFDEDYKKERAEFRKKFKVDGKATERVVNLIYEMIA